MFVFRVPAQWNLGRVEGAPGLWGRGEPRFMGRIRRWR